MDGLVSYILSQNYTNKAIAEASRDGFDVSIEQNRSILNGSGEEKIFYFIPKAATGTSDGYEEYIYVNNSWEKVGSTDIDLSEYATKNWVTGQIAEIIKTDISSATVTLNTNSFVYDGTPKVPSVTAVVLNNIQLTYGTDYTVIVNPATNVGSYVVTVAGIGDYIGTINSNWGITKAQATINGDDSIVISSLNKPILKTYTTTGNGTFSFSLSDNIGTISNSGGTVTITPSAYGTTNLTIIVAESQNYLGATKTVPVEIKEVPSTFGVVWDYSLSSPVLTRLSPQTDPLGVVTTLPAQEPTACVGNIGGQSDFDNYMPWAGIERYNYTNGQVVDFVDYNNGETFVYIPEFWSKLIEDSTNKKIYFYISSNELEGFTKHYGSDRYVGRYELSDNFLSCSNLTPKVNANLEEFRTGVTSIDNKHFQFDFSVCNALELLYIVEWANFNSQAMIGVGTSLGKITGQTDILTYHTGRTDESTDGMSAIQYRWIENLWGNTSNWVDGILFDYQEVTYLCNDRTKYSSTVTSDYESTELFIPYKAGWLHGYSVYNNCYLIPKQIKSSRGSSSTYVCDYCSTGSDYNNVGLIMGQSQGSDYDGLFAVASTRTTNTQSNTGGRSILVIE